MCIPRCELGDFKAPMSGFGYGPSYITNCLQTSSREPLQFCFDVYVLDLSLLPFDIPALLARIWRKHVFIVQYMYHK
ncbi:hypothetical protein M378DRAFT_318067 [Amanita muscaria Koide BX008]|uniref:Uncharacterized protein n=1 Tax=Amanita muscaria (strain Koide BX008) TaxID=946122 RepID=A0A0C2S6K3_AMAMK|nr:hypothetical protein M378DRAFT_318067 [Amanita muscaria Koide BX008]